MNNEFLLPGERAVQAGDRVRVIDNGRGLCWGTDAYLLAAFVRARRRASGPNTSIDGQEPPRKLVRACELGSGCGVISFLVAAHEKADRITALEVNDDAFDRTCRGILLNGFGARVQALRRDIRQVSSRDPDLGAFDFVFSNPPYIAHPGLAGADAVAEDARHENHGGIGEFCAAAARLLKPRGSFYVVWRPERAADLFCALRENHLEPKRATFVYPDGASRPNLMLTEAVLRGAPGLCFSPPLLFYRDKKEITPRVMSAQAAQIYESCSFDCLFAQSKRGEAPSDHE